MANGDAKATMDAVTNNRIPTIQPAMLFPVRLFGDGFAFSVWRNATQSMCIGTWKMFAPLF